MDFTKREVLQPKQPKAARVRIKRKQPDASEAARLFAYASATEPGPGSITGSVPADLIPADALAGTGSPGQAIPNPTKEALDGNTMTTENEEKPASADANAFDGIIREQRHADADANKGAKGDGPNEQFIPPPEFGAAPPPPPPEAQPSGPILGELFFPAFAVLAPNWKINPHEAHQLGMAWGAVLDKYWPGGVAAMGPIGGAVLITAAVIGPRVAQRIPPRLPPPPPETGVTGKADVPADLRKPFHESEAAPVETPTASLEETPNAEQLQ